MDAYFVARAKGVLLNSDELKEIWRKGKEGMKYSNKEAAWNLETS